MLSEQAGAPDSSWTPLRTPAVATSPGKAPRHEFRSRLPSALNPHVPGSPTTGIVPSAFKSAVETSLPLGFPWGEAGLSPLPAAGRQGGTRPGPRGTRSSRLVSDGHGTRPESPVMTTLTTAAGRRSVGRLGDRPPHAGVLEKSGRPLGRVRDCGDRGWGHFLHRKHRQGNRGVTRRGCLGITAGQGSRDCASSPRGHWRCDVSDSHNRGAMLLASVGGTRNILRCRGQPHHTELPGPSVGF